jgi:hypothetical protein
MEKTMAKITDLQQKNLETGKNDFIFSIYDNVANVYEPPFTEKNKGTAIRRIQDLIQNNQNSPYAKFPDNFALYHIGYFDTDDGSILDIESSHTINFEDLSPILNKE